MTTTPTTTTTTPAPAGNATPAPLPTHDVERLELDRRVNAIRAEQTTQRGIMRRSGDVPTVYAAAKKRYDELLRAEEELLYAEITPRVGMGITWSAYSDRHAGTIVAIERKGSVIVVREDCARLLNGFNSGAEDALTFSPGGFCGHTDGTQRYEYTPGGAGGALRFSKRTVRTRRGTETRWVRAGQSSKGTSGARLGERDKHHDYNF